MKRTKAEELLDKYASGSTTKEEKALVESWYLQHKAEDQSDIAEQIIEYQRYSLQQLKLHIHKKKKQDTWQRIAVAATIVAFLSAGLYFFAVKPHKSPAYTTEHQNDIAPGGNNAYLTLANGKKIRLSGAANGKLAEEPGVEIIKTEDGKLIYSHSGGRYRSADMAFNEIETPRSGQYQVLLPDGSHVWLNAASSLRYPVSFRGKERRVELIGEAYFEISKDASRPFKVISTSQEVRVLGTHFNINSYPDEATIKTTLLEGSVGIFVQGIQPATLKPGEEGTFNNQEITKTKVDGHNAIAWKNGDFVFRDQDLKQIMRQIARWYDVDVYYDNPPANLRLWATVSRQNNLSVVLNAIEKTGKVKFRIEGRRVMVTK